MRKRITKLYRPFIFLGILICPLLSLAQQNRPCNQPEFRQFDFWVGEWELTWPGGQGGTPEGTAGEGRNIIRTILGGCVIQENFSTADSTFIGKSWSVYNPRLGKWQQTWVDNRGGYLLFTGEFKNGKMVLSTAPFERNGKTLVSRMVFENITETSLNWNWQRSEDQGKAWVDLWNIHYERKK